MCKKFGCHHSLTRVLYPVSIAVFVTAGLVAGIYFSTPPVKADLSLNSLSYVFGGHIEISEIEVCLIPGPVFPIPIPFRYIEVGDPMPASLYDLDGISQEYDNYNAEQVGVWSLGTYIPDADKLFLAACLNAEDLPVADGVIDKIGTGDTGGDSGISSFGLSN